MHIIYQHQLHTYSYTIPEMFVPYLQVGREAVATCSEGQCWPCCSRLLLFCSPALLAPAQVSSLSSSWRGKGRVGWDSGVLFTTGCQLLQTTHVVEQRGCETRTQAPPCFYSLPFHVQLFYMIASPSNALCIF